MISQELICRFDGNARSNKSNVIYGSRRRLYLILFCVVIVGTSLPGPSVANIVTYLHADVQGTVILETDQNRNVVQRFEYEPYGLPRQSMADTPGYTGHVHDAGTDLVYMQQRYYDPEVGQFLSIDSVGVDGSTGKNFNRYWYANNSPYSFVDPDGRVPVETVWDVANVAMGVKSAYDNFSQGNVVSGLVDTAGVVLDTAAVLTPYVPGGMGTVIRATREADSVADAVRVTGTSADAGRASTLTPGPHASESIRIGPGRPTAQQQRDVNAIGDANGCHTCGTTDPGTVDGHWVVDHQPATTLNTSGAPQRGHPHCIDCSRRQGGEVNAQRARERRERENE